jgi:hypothetical protein
MQTRDKGKQSVEEDERRDLEFENIAGNMLIAEYQADKLRTLVGLVDGFRLNKASTHIFKHNNKWYKLSLRIDETGTNSIKEVGHEEFTGYSTKR